jgi:hypothetical protein
MKIYFYTSIAIFITKVSFGQGSFVYDQQSVAADNNGGGAEFPLQQSQTAGQSFTPELSSVGFIRLWLANGYLDDTSAATVIVNLLANSITGTILSQSEPVVTQSGTFSAPVDFIFATPVTVTPGVTYYFQPVIQDNDNLYISGTITSDPYAGGTAFRNGQAIPTQDLWFREGIVAPEPSPSWLIFLGSGIFFYARRKFIH